MAFERKPNTFSLFANKRKDPNNPAHKEWADRDGSMLIEHCCSKCGHKELVDHWLNGWLKKPGTADQFIQGVLKLKQQQQQSLNVPAQTTQRGQGDMGYSQERTAPARSTRPLASDIDDEIPF